MLAAAVAWFVWVLRGGEEPPEERKKRVLRGIQLDKAGDDSVVGLLRQKRREWP